MEDTVILDVNTTDGKLIPIEFDYEALLQHHYRVLDAMSILRAGQQMRVV